MALPADSSFVPYDEGAGKAESVDSYKLTCMDFVKDISNDYLAWVEYYKLPSDEDKKRRNEIASVITRTNDWIAKVAQTIKGVDVAMNDGIQKMAEATAGKPFQIGVFINKKSEYTFAKSGLIDITVKATGRENCQVALGTHYQQNRFRLESTGDAHILENDLYLEKSDLLDFHLTLDATKCTQRDLISFTVVIGEFKDGMEIDRRGASTIVHIV